MAITGIDTIEGKQIIAAGAVSAKSAEMAYNDENGNPITGYQVAGDYYSASNPSGFITGVDLSPYQTTAGMTAYQSAGDYYSASNPSGFITGVDLTPYQLTADMTAYQPTGNYLTTADSANFYTTANESGFITGVPAGTMNESAFGYDASNNITAYNGSAFKAGDEFPQSATEAIETVTANSANWNGTTETVSSNSGAWGGSALPISAGPGIKLAMVNNTLVASTDETVLYSAAAGTSAVALSESIENFESIKLVHNTQVEEFWKPKSGDAVRYWHTYGTMNQGVYKMAMIHLSMPDTTHITNISAKTLNFPLTGTTFTASVVVNDTYALNTIREVIGINRIAGGN